MKYVVSLSLSALLTVLGGPGSGPFCAATEAPPAPQQLESTSLVFITESAPQPLPKYLLLTAPSDRESEYQQEKAADLVVHFTTWDSLKIKESAQSVSPPIGKAELQTYIQLRHIGNALAVVVFSKSQPSASTVDEVVAEFHALGFDRVIVQQAANYKGRAVLKDSRAKCSLSPPSILFDTAAKNKESSRRQPESH